MGYLKPKRMNNISKIIYLKKSQGQKVKIQELARKLFPDSTLTGAQQNFHNLRSGKVKRLTIEQIKILQDELGCTFDELFVEGI